MNFKKGCAMLPGSRLLLICTVLIFCFAVPAFGAPEQAFYVGTKVCRQCHQGPAGADTFSAWYRSAHARAYAALALEESKEIARLSGIDIDPYQSPICLGCHSTASDVEPWERETSFTIEDGVQCEYCHGPGSEYLAAEVMADPEAAARAGLRIPGEQFCLMCHREKGSHQAVLKKEPFEFQKFLPRIAHGGSARITDTGRREGAGEGPEYVGAGACGVCHQGQRTGMIYSQWRLSAHANAYVDLDSEAGREIAREMGLVGDPQQAKACLGCHATGQQAPARFAETFRIELGVQCESCHGQRSSSPMGNSAAAQPRAHQQVGPEVGSEVCTHCHNGIHGRTFQFEEMLAQMTHERVGRQVNIPVEPEYKTPTNLVLNRDGSRLFIACEASDSLIIVDTRTRSVLTEIKLENQPNDLYLSHDESWVYVSNRGSDSVSVVEVASGRVVETIAVGDEPHGLVTDVDGKILYVANGGSADVSVVDLTTGREIKRLAAGRGPWGVSRSPNGDSILVTNNLPYFGEFRTSSRSEVTVVGAQRGRSPTASLSLMPIWFRESISPRTVNLPW
jgi:YVTN family beta-propeller protein